MRIREPGLRRSLAMAFACFGLAGLGLVAAIQKQSADGPEHKEYDQPVFEAAKAKLLDRSADHRLSALDEIVKRNAKEVREILATVLDDPSQEIRRRAAEYLAMMGGRARAQSPGTLPKGSRVFRHQSSCSALTWQFGPLRVRPADRRRS